ncbi:polyketide synthase [Escherichia coli]|uniref:Polyketide synthase n=1 Tax=Escherichia coli TaxID=562 RepID=A0A377K4T0_ECOLX|nr:polyketide synthase [Escherichia coli]
MTERFSGTLTTHARGRATRLMVDDNVVCDLTGLMREMPHYHSSNKGIIEHALPLWAALAQRTTTVWQYRPDSGFRNAGPAHRCR